MSPDWLDGSRTAVTQSVVDEFRSLNDNSAEGQKYYLQGKP